MNDIDHLIDEVLAADSGIDPGSAFTARVMRAVRNEATLPPIGFPWRRMAAAAALLGAIIVTALAAPQALPVASVSPAIAFIMLATVVSALVLLMGIEMRGTP